MTGEKYGWVPPSAATGEQWGQGTEDYRAGWLDKLALSNPWEERRGELSKLGSPSSGEKDGWAALQKRVAECKGGFHYF